MNKIGQRKRKEAIAKIKKAVALLCLLAAGFYYVLTEKSPASEQLIYLESGTQTEIASETAAELQTSAVSEAEISETVPEIVQETTAEEKEKIDLNQATLEELDTLPGIGPATAQLIVEYRETYGGFAAVEEIMNVKRIGDKTFEKIRDYIVVR